MRDVCTYVFICLLFIYEKIVHLVYSSGSIHTVDARCRYCFCMKSVYLLFSRIFAYCLKVVDLCNIIQGVFVTWCVWYVFFSYLYSLS